MLLRVAMVVLTGEASTVTAASADANAVRAMANGAPLVATNRTCNTFTLSRKGYYGRMGGHRIRRRPHRHRRKTAFNRRRRRLAKPQAVVDAERGLKRHSVKVGDWNTFCANLACIERVAGLLHGYYCSPALAHQAHHKAMVKQAALAAIVKKVRGTRCELSFVCSPLC